MSFQVACAQIKPKKADYAHNLCRIGDLFEQLSSMNPRPDVLALPETVMTGYFLEGGVREAAVSSERLFADLLALYRERSTPSAQPLDIVVGFYELHDGDFYNSALYATLTSAANTDIEARIASVHRKFFLPTYGVFDEERFVGRGRHISTFDTRFGRAAILICEDAWHSVSGTIAALKGAQTIYIPSASPARGFGTAQIGSLERWERLLHGMAEEHGVFIVYSGLVGFEGGKGFSGSSRVVNPLGKTLAQAPAMEESIVSATVELEEVAIARANSPLLSDLQANLPEVVHNLIGADSMAFGYQLAR